MSNKLEGKLVDARGGTTVVSGSANIGAKVEYGANEKYFGAFVEHAYVCKGSAGPINTQIGFSSRTGAAYDSGNVEVKVFGTGIKVGFS